MLPSFLSVSRFLPRLGLAKARSLEPGVGLCCVHFDVSQGAHEHVAGVGARTEIWVLCAQFLLLQTRFFLLELATIKLPCHIAIGADTCVVTSFVSVLWMTRNTLLDPAPICEQSNGIKVHSYRPLENDLLEDKALYS